MRAEDIRRHRRQAREFHRATGGFLGDSVCCGGISVPQCHVLLALDEAGGNSLVGLAEALGLDKSTVSRTVEGLVGRGLVARSEDTDDRRYVVLDLTNQGKETVAVVNGIADGNVEKIFSLIPSDRRADVLECFGLLVEAVRACGGEDGPECAAAREEEDT